MTFKVLKSGRGAIYGHRKDEVVATGLTWREAHEKCLSLHDMCGGTWDIWMTRD